MRKKTRGRGSGRARGGGTTSSRNNSTSCSSIIGPTKTTTILAAFQRQSSPYIRQVRGGLGRTIKSAINSVISDNDIMNNNTFAGTYPRNGTVDTFSGKVNGVHEKINGEIEDGYLHKKFKKVTTAEVTQPNGVIPTNQIHHANNTLTFSRGEEDKFTKEIPEVFSGSNGVTSGGSVYKPKFRISSDKETPIVSSGRSQIQSQPSQSHLNLQFDAQFALSRLQEIPLQPPRATIQSDVPIRSPPMLQPTPAMAHRPLQPPIPTAFSLEMLNDGNGRIEKRIDRQSLDDRISKIINENQSILATWPEHLTKRSKGNGGRYSLNTRSTSHSFGMGMGEPSRRDSLDFVMSSRTDQIGLTVKSTTNQRTNHHLIRSNSDLSQQILYREHDVVVDNVEDLSKHSDSSFMIPKKRRRLSPVHGNAILSGGEVAELQKTVVPLTPGHCFPTVNNFHQQKQQELDLTLQMSNCGNSGAKAAIRITGEVIPSAPVSSLAQHSRLMSIHDESSNSSSTSSSMSLISPESRQNTIRIRKDSIFEMDSSSSSSLASVPNTTAAPGNKRRGRPSKQRPEEASKIRKVVEKLQSHLNAKTAALAAIVRSSPPSAAMEAEKSSLLLAITQKQQPIITSASYNQTNTRVPVPSNVSMSTVPGEQHEIPDKASLLLHTSALNPKRPTFLALKPTNGIVAKKRMDQLSCVLPSPETPRGAKHYNQMHINGNAYTYLGFKISTKSSYTCLFKPQPMFVPQETDPKLSMYSNWQPRPKNPNENAQLKLSSYDSRVNSRKSPDPLYIVSLGHNFDTLTVNSPENSTPRSSTLTMYNSNFSCSNNTNNSPYLSHGQHLMRDDPSTVLMHEPLSPSPPPPPDSPELTIDERPEAERNCLVPPSPSVPIVHSRVESPVTTTYTSQPIGATANIEVSPRYRKKGTCFPPDTQKLTLVHDVTTSSSESSSADESPRQSHHYSLDHRDHPQGKGRSISLCIDRSKDEMSMDLSKPLSLTIGGSKDRQRSQSVSLSSPSAILSNLDSARVKIMEGGFESNEDYTYVRGRGRGRYVCESCGIRCKKPSMLRKHLKTHTDLRPYTCKLCNFSFKTKGNLTKHQKSKSHHKKCMGLGIHPNSSRSLEMTGPISDSNDEGDSDDDDEDEDENDSDSVDDPEEDNLSVDNNYNDKEKFEKEIALSLLDLSQMSRLSEKRDRTVSENNTNQSNCSPLPSSSRKMSSFSSPGILQSTSTKLGNECEAPIDLSVKATRSAGSFDSQSQPKLFGGMVKSMEIVGEAQRWEPEEEFFRNGYLNLTKVRNFVDLEKEQRSSVESIKIEVPESLQPSAEDKTFRFEITKRRRVSTASSIPQESQSSNRPLSISSSLAIPIPPPPTSDKTILPHQSVVSTTSQPKRLHQPWLSPQEFSQEAEVRNTKERTKAFSSMNGGETKFSSANVIGTKRKEGKVEVKHSLIPTQMSIAVTTIPSSMTGVNGIKIPTTSNGTSSVHAFSGLLGLKPQAEFRQPSGAQLLDEGKAECNVCGKTFSRAGQLTLHMNIHYLERPFRCDPCGVSFRTKGHLIKHRRSSSHDCKVYLTEAWGVANEENPRPFKCTDCKIAFRIHGHLAKHLRSKLHIMRMECLGKLPFGIYVEMEKSGLNLNEIDTTDCDMSLVSLQSVAQKIYGEEWRDKLSAPIEDPA